MEFRDRRSFATMHEAECPFCGQNGRANRNNGKRVVQVLMPRVNQISDVDHSEGRTGDKIFMPAFGKYVSSRREISELQKRARENLWNRTVGRHETMVPDPETGKMEKVTVTSDGIDVGEIRTVGNEPIEQKDHAGDAMKELKKGIEESIGRKLGPDERTNRSR
jgi:hypothetical protein